MRRNYFPPPAGGGRVRERGRISLVQQGIIVQCEFAKFLMLGSGGRIEVAAPLTDEERRDFEIHVRGDYGSPLAIQVKSTIQLSRQSPNTRWLRIRFAVRARRVVNDPTFYYFFALLDSDEMGLADPCFLVPSTEVHRHANPRKTGDFWSFNFEASMEPNSQDKWADYRLRTVEIGKKALAIMRQRNNAH